MQSEEEKYYLIDQFLKGKLSENEEAVLKRSFSVEEFRKETQMHKLANEAIEENYLLGIRAATKKVIKRNSAWQTGKWVAGTCFVAAGIIAYTIYTENEIKQKPAPLINQVSVKNTVKQLIGPSKPGIKERSTIKPDKINQTTNFSKPDMLPVTQKEEQEYILLPKPSLEELNKQEIFTESLPVEKANTDNKVSAPLIIPKEDKAPVQELSVPQSETTELILNPNRDEIIYFPVEEGFNGELVLFDATGNMLLKRRISNGWPKEWDGILESGGKANPGQYVFVIKSHEGKEVKQGYITVVR